MVNSDFPVLGVYTCQFSERSVRVDEVDAFFFNFHQSRCIEAVME